MGNVRYMWAKRDHEHVLVVVHPREVQTRRATSTPCDNVQSLSVQRSRDGVKPCNRGRDVRTTLSFKHMNEGALIRLDQNRNRRASWLPTAWHDSTCAHPFAGRAESPMRVHMLTMPTYART